MKHHLINPATCILLCSLWIITGCGKDSLVTQVTPEAPGYDTSILPTTTPDARPDGPTYVAGHAEGETGEIWQPTQMHVASFLDITIPRKSAEGPVPAGHPETSQSSEVAPEGVMWVYKVGGSGMTDHEALGSVSVDFKLQTNPYTHTSVGRIVIQSLSGQASVLDLSLNGSGNISSITTDHGYSFGLQVIEASGRFAGINSYATGRLAVDAEDSTDLAGQLSALLTLNLNMGPA